MPASCSVQLLSSSISRRCLALILKWNWHLGQTKRFSSRSLRKVMVRQFSHLVHRPSVRTRRSSGGLASAIAYFSRLNHAISRCFLSAAIARTQATDTGHGGENSSLHPFQFPGRRAATQPNPQGATPEKARDARSNAPPLNSLYHAGREYPCYRGVSLP